MKLGLFTDSHYSSQEVTCGCRYNSRSLEKMSKAYEAFEQAGCELVICLGDLTDHEESHAQEILNLQAAAKVMVGSQIPTFCVMGNHDGFSFTVEEFYGLLGTQQPQVYRAGEKTLLFLDACFFQSGAHYMPGDSDWTDTFLPDPEKLKHQLEAAEGEVIVFLHQNIDPEIREDHCLHNRARVREILEQSGKVRTVYQGHYHPGKVTEHNGIRYVTLPAMCEGEGRWRIEEI